jgi:HEAT repeat protein
MFGPVREQAGRALVPLFDHPRDPVRQWAIDTLVGLEVRTPVEAALTGDATARTREATALCLGMQPRGDPPVAPSLRSALADSNFAVRFAAAEAIHHLTGWDSNTPVEAIAVLIEGLRHAAESVRLAAARDLVRIGPPAKAAVPLLKECFADPNLDIALEAALGVLGIDPTDSAEATPVLTRGLTASDQDAYRSAGALGRIGPSARTAIPALLLKLEAINLDVRIAAANAVVKIEPGLAGKATDALIGVLRMEEFENVMLHGDVGSVLARIGPDARAALPILLDLLVKDPGPYTADLALAAVMIDPEGGASALRWIGDRLPRDNGNDAYSLAERVPLLGPRAAPLLPDLLRMLKATTPAFRQNAVEALKAIGPNARDALPQLKEAAQQDPDADVRRSAAEVVAALEGKGQP